MSQSGSLTAKLALPSQVADVLHKLATTAHTFDTDEQIYDAIVQAILEVFPADRISALINYPLSPILPLDNAFEWGSTIDHAVVQDASLKPDRISRTTTTQVRYDIHGHTGEPVEQSLFESGFRELLINPVLIDHSNVLSLNVLSKRPKAFLDQHCNAIAAIAGMMGLMISGLKFRREAQFRANEAELLAETGRLMGSTLQADEVAARALRQIATSLKTSVLALIYRDGSWTPWELAGSLDPSADLHWTSGRILALPEFAMNIDRDTATLSDGPPTLRPLVTAVSAQLESDGVTAHLIQALPFDNDTAWIVIAIRNGSPSSGMALPFSDDDRRLLKLMLRYVTPSWLNAVLHEALSRSLTEREALRRMSTIAATETDPKARVQLVARTAHFLLGSDYVTFQIAEGSSVDVLFRCGSLRLPESGLLSKTWPDVAAIQEFVLGADDAPRFLDASTSGDLSRMPIHRQEQLRSSLTIPFKLGPHLRGSLLFGFRSSRKLSQTDLRFARLLTDTVVESIRLDILASR